MHEQKPMAEQLKTKTMLKAKLIHLDEKTIEILTIQAVKEKTTFKELAQNILKNIAALKSKKI